MKIKKEFKDIGNFINVESADKTDHFNVLYNLDTKKYYKVYNKAKFLRKTITNTNIGTPGIVYEILLPFFRKNHTFLPKLHYEIKNYLFFDYYIDYSPPEASDFIDTPIASLSRILGIPNKINNKNLNPTILFNEVANSFKKIYLEEKVHEPMPKYIEEIYASVFNFKTNLKKLNYLTISPSNIALSDFVVKRDKNNNILDWKYVDMGNFSIQPPRYIFNLDEKGDYPIDYRDLKIRKGGDDAITFAQLIKLTDSFENCDAIYCFDKKWHIYKYS